MCALEHQGSRRPRFGVVVGGGVLKETYLCGWGTLVPIGCVNSKVYSPVVPVAH